MGIIKQGILGALSKKVGNVVGASWKGIPVLRIYQPIVANPKTAAQITARSEFKDVVFVAQEVLATIIKPLWDRFAVHMSGYNAFVQAQKLVGGGMQADAKDMIFAKGVMEKTDITNVVLDQDGNATFTMPSGASGRYQLSTDVLYLVFVGMTQGKELLARGFMTPATRANTTFTLSSDLWTEIGITGSVGIRAIYKRADGTVVSNQSSLYTLALS